MNLINRATEKQGEKVMLHFTVTLISEPSQSISCWMSPATACSESLRAGYLPSRRQA